MHSKNAQRLDEARLAEALCEQDLADAGALQELLEAAQGGGQPFCESVVSSKLVSDWELSRVAAEIFQLPFLPVDISRPDSDLWGELGSELFCSQGVVPLRRFGDLLTVALPGAVSAEVLGRLAEETGHFLMPVVGTVQTNRRWIQEQTAAEPGQNKNWGTLFDEGEAAVQANLDGASGPIDPPSLVGREVEPECPEAHGASLMDLPPPPTFQG